MKITLCGSIAFYHKMLEVKAKLEKLGHRVELPPQKVPNDKGEMIPVQEYYAIRHTAEPSHAWVWDRKAIAIREHFEKVVNADAILVLNYSKKSIDGYIGANTLLEMGLAFYLKKKIFLLNPIPQMQYTEEILGLKPLILNNDLTKIQ